MDQKIKKRSEIEEGDTFLFKIENSQDKDLNGRYFAIIYTVIPFWDKMQNWYACRIKLTRDKKVPQTKEDLENMEYVKIGAILPFDRFSFLQMTKPIDDEIKAQEKVPFTVDEFGLINTYVFEIYMGNKSPFKEFDYIGNFKISKPYNEFIPFHRSIKGCASAYIKYLEEVLLRCYKLFNLQKADIYNPEKSDEVRERLFAYYCEEYRINKYMQEREDESKRIPEMEYFFRDRSEEKRKENSLTYVGGKDATYENVLDEKINQNHN